MRRTAIGLGILLVVALVALVASRLDPASLLRRAEARAPVDLAIFYGGEKTAFLQNPDVRDIIEDRYRITLDATRAGSVEMVTTLDTTGKDCLWPSNMVAVEMARNAGKPVTGETTVFSSPIVFYAWTEVADALQAAGAVRDENGVLSADIGQIAEMIGSGKRWKEDLGLNIYGPFRIFTTDPTKSNSGNIFAGLLVTAFNGGETPTPDTLPALLPRVDSYFAAMGYMEASSGDIFEAFLKQGMGARPIIVGYENQLVEFLRANAEYADLIRSKIRVIYPAPTIYASHPLIALTPDCKRLAEALSDPEVQALAWSGHGFRTGLIGVENDPAAIEVATLPATVPLVVPMPSAEVMEAVVHSLE